MKKLKSTFIIFGKQYPDNPSL